MQILSGSAILSYFSTNSVEDVYTFDVSRIFPNQFKLPKDLTIGECVWIPIQLGTSFSAESSYITKKRFEKEIEGPCLLPNRKFRIKVTVKNIIEGKLSDPKT